MLTNHWDGHHYTSAAASAASFAGHILLQAALPTCVSRSCSRCSKAGDRCGRDATGAGGPGTTRLDLPNRNMRWNSVQTPKCHEFHLIVLVG